MSALGVRAKVASGLAKANARVGEDNSPIVNLIRSTTTGGDGSPINPGTVSNETIELVNAIFKAIDFDSINSELIKKGDMELVCDGSVVIEQGDTITQGAIKYIVVHIFVSSPYGVALAYKPIVRKQ